MKLAKNDLFILENEINIFYIHVDQYCFIKITFGSKTKIQSYNKQFHIGISSCHGAKVFDIIGL